MLIGAQAFQETPKSHAPAIILALDAAPGGLGQAADRQRPAAPAGTNAARASGSTSSARCGVLYEGLACMGGGSILGGLDARRDRACSSSTAHFMQGSRVRVGGRRADVLRLHARRSRSASAQTPIVAISYLGVATVLYGCARLGAVAIAPAEEPHGHGEPEPLPAAE